MAAFGQFKTNPFEELIIKITSSKDPLNLKKKNYEQSARNFVYKDENTGLIKSHLNQNIYTKHEFNLDDIIEKYNIGEYTELGTHNNEPITREHVDAYLKKYDYENVKIERYRSRSGGKPKSNKKRKTNKRKKTKRRKTKTNKRKKTKSKTNKRTRRRR